MCAMLLLILISIKNLHYAACIKHVFKGTYLYLEATKFMQN